MWFAHVTFGDLMWNNSSTLPSSIPWIQLIHNDLFIVINLNYCRITLIISGTYFQQHSASFPKGKHHLCLKMFAIQTLIFSGRLFIYVTTRVLYCQLMGAFVFRVCLHCTYVVLILYPGLPLFWMSLSLLLANAFRSHFIFIPDLPCMNTCLYQKLSTFHQRVPETWYNPSETLY